MHKLITRAVQEKRKVRKYGETYEEEVQKSFRLNLTIFRSGYTNHLYFPIVLTSPGKKQQCFRSICLPKLICSKVSRICRVSMISDSQAKG